ncbi:SDR family NAD(P)-dependent oxidoreductase [Pseudomonas sp. CF161]|uniref:SDR family NAD(P)-dependent oxidoreductase n=1 Tax=Pseudomonas sp. CF161 TaxID=911241 RepID=UPI0003552E9C|nr:SDR family oxidoreductase [Pseudomonas sp. CF161]EPL15586.1 oxidoreductase [Pseudomonas sp. CF161]
MTIASRFQNKSIIVTGGASGIGRASVIRLVSEGGTVLAVDRNADGLRETLALANAAAGYGGAVRSAQVSITEESEVRDSVQAFVQEQGRLDVLVNMAGILRSTHTTHTSFEDFMQVLQINLGGTFLFCREALPFLLETRGNIVNAASTSAFFGHPYMAAYSASKGGIAALTQALSREYLNRGVRVNAVAPGGISTPMVAAQAQAFPEGSDFTLLGHLSRPDRQFGEPQDVAAVIAMLASEDGAFMNGAILRIDGGTHG